MCIRHIKCQLRKRFTVHYFIFRLRDEKPSALEVCVATAGFSVGEITALAFAGALSFEDGE